MNFPSTTVQTGIDTPLGRMVLAATDAGLAGAWFTDQRHRPPELAAAHDFKAREHAWPSNDRHPTLRAASRQLGEYFSQGRQVFDLAFDINGGTEFQQSVWRALLTIKLGQTCTYGDIARRIGKPDAVRAVGAAVGRNPLGILIPCHRVVGANQSLTGYAGGLQRKTWLLRHEGWGVADDELDLARSRMQPSASAPNGKARLRARSDASLPLFRD